jgi:hypothetical protein
MWKLIRFLRDFTYDPERLSKSKVDERAMRGIVGVVKVIHRVVNALPTFRTAVLRRRFRCDRLRSSCGLEC